jgi:hypothetical protein
VAGRKGSLYRRKFRSSEKGGSKVGKTKRGKGTKIMAVADRHGLPVAVCIESATPHEVKLATGSMEEKRRAIAHYYETEEIVAGDDPTILRRVEYAIRELLNRSPWR